MFYKPLLWACLIYLDLMVGGFLRCLQLTSHPLDFPSPSETWPLHGRQLCHTALLPVRLGVSSSVPQTQSLQEQNDLEFGYRIGSFMILMERSLNSGKTCETERMHCGSVQMWTHGLRMRFLATAQRQIGVVAF